jgi:methylmalonyl-CoA mutase
MESMYQRGKIQEESLYYETLKDSGEFPIIGVNTFLPEKMQDWKPIELSRASESEKNDQIQRLENFKSKHQNKSGDCLNKLRQVALSGGNIFEELLTTVRYCSLGEITSVLYEVGGRYRRNM